VISSELSSRAMLNKLLVDIRYSRLVQNIRSQDGPSTSSSLTKDWDFNIEERDAEFRDDLREASGVGRRRGKVSVMCRLLHMLNLSTQQRGRQTGPALSQQVRSLIGDGNQAYVDNNLREAIRIMQEVIRIEPRAASAWSVLAQCYEDMNEHDKALQLRIMAAHLRHDADEWDRLAHQSRYNSIPLYTHYSCADFKFAESSGLTNRHCIVTVRYTAWTHPMSMPYGTAPPSLKKQATSRR
jgi:general transcription factor 3C polypeptide 3 (transcription factor C subunit 4)